ncbi:uncharacterized protein BX663DRAFT_449307, partial [Cokeromyces recurvatus]|uniref:uncharacterized protein n=1 Tax=Cokeromyces recurvatus TaxID=90255 RepID=UPI0022211CC9
MTEKCQSRRLVRFWSEHYVQRNGSQSNDLLKCGYHIQEDSSDYYAQPNDPLLVSCIYWKAVDKYFITSVDYIRLLEGLLRVRYTFQEKNRVRRNLSAFSNITIKNNDPKTVDFYKLIMSYSNPKPRNIDKDIKAFEWYTVPYAITKVINRF